MLHKRPVSAYPCGFPRHPFADPFLIKHSISETKRPNKDQNQANHRQQSRNIKRSKALNPDPFYVFSCTASYSEMIFAFVSSSGTALRTLKNRLINVKFFKKSVKTCDDQKPFPKSCDKTRSPPDIQPDGIFLPTNRNKSPVWALLGEVG